MMPAHPRPAPRNLIDLQTAAIRRLVHDLLGLAGLAALLSFAAGVGTAGPLLRSLFGG